VPHEGDRNDRTSVLPWDRNQYKSSGKVQDQVCEFISKEPIESLKGQAYHVVIVAFDALDKNSAEIVLNAIGPGFIHGRPRRYVVLDLSVRQRAERDLCRLDDGPGTVGGRVKKREPCIDGMGPCLQGSKHGTGLGGI